MKIKKNILTVSFSLLLSAPLFASPSLNDMQSCQGLLDFLDSKLSSLPSKYSSADVKKVRRGLKGYNEFIQSDIVSPGLLKYNGGDASKANAMQEQVNAYKAKLVQSFKEHYPQNRIFTDQAIAVNNCAKKAVPSGQALEDLQVAINTMVKLANIK